jgi:3-hydroxyacyl-CoA dehydrogenase/enoyl-CoA hydratase/3-hydroxybutyryl-CoA epimerase
MAAAVEGAQVDFDTASEIEGRYFVDLVCGQVAKNMIQAFFFDLQRVTGDRGRPPEIEPFRPVKLAVLGAGMMGAAIAYVCARSGVEVVLKDVSQDAADRGKEYSRKLVAKAVERGLQSQEEADALLARITPTTDPTVADGADMVIEAVFEDPEVKAEVLAEIERHLAPHALVGSNTSTLPITNLARNVSRPQDFVGLHFFSPAEKMPLLEIIRGEHTSDETVYRALDFAKLVKKTPILVNDSRGKPVTRSRYCSSQTNSTSSSCAKSVIRPSTPPTCRRAAGPLTRQSTSSTGCSTTSSGPGGSRTPGFMSTRTASALACGRDCARPSPQSPIPHNSTCVT